MKVKIKILFLCLCGIISAQTTIWNGTADVSWYNDRDTMLYISTAEQLAGLAELVNDKNKFENKTIKLVSDIWLNDTSGWQSWDKFSPTNEWTPIGKLRAWLPAARYFSGTFDGNGKAVYGMYINYTITPVFVMESQGLFGMIYDAKITNLMVSNFYISSRNAYTGSIAGFGGESVISECSMKGKIDGNLAVGGVCGGSKFYGAYAFQYYCKNLLISDNLVFVDVSSKQFGGGISGIISNSQVSKNKFAGKISGRRKPGILVGKAQGQSFVIYNDFSSKDDMEIVGKVRRRVTVNNNNKI